MPFFWIGFSYKTLCKSTPFLAHFWSFLSILFKIIDFYQFYPKLSFFTPNSSKNLENLFFGTPPTSLFSGLILDKKSEFTRYPLCRENIQFMTFLTIFVLIIKSLRIAVGPVFLSFFSKNRLWGVNVDCFFMFFFIFFAL